MKATDHKPHATHSAATRADDAETDTGVLGAALARKHHHHHHVERDLTDMPGGDHASDASEVTPEPAHNLEADIVAAEDVGDGTCRITINRGTDDHVYPWLTGILGGKDGAHYAVKITSVSDGAAKAVVDTTLYMIQHHSTMTVIVNPDTAGSARPHTGHPHKHKHHKHRE